MSEKFRWKIARTLNRLPGYCWADLVTWALGWHGYSLVKDNRCRVSHLCRSDLERNGSCYCGNLRSSAVGSVSLALPQQEDA